jgi:hypothetical protein
MYAVKNPVVTPRAKGGWCGDAFRAARVAPAGPSFGRREPRAASLRSLPGATICRRSAAGVARWLTARASAAWPATRNGSALARQQRSGPRPLQALVRRRGEMPWVFAAGDDGPILREPEWNRTEFTNASPLPSFDSGTPNGPGFSRAVRDAMIVQLGWQEPSGPRRLQPRVGRRLAN